MKKYNDINFLLVVINVALILWALLTNQLCAWSFLNLLVVVVNLFLWVDKLKTQKEAENNKHISNN